MSIWDGRRSSCSILNDLYSRGVEARAQMLVLALSILRRVSRCCGRAIHSLQQRYSCGPFYPQGVHAVVEDRGAVGVRFGIQRGALDETRRYLFVFLAREQCESSLGALGLDAGSSGGPEEGLAGRVAASVLVRDVESLIIAELEREARFVGGVELRARRRTPHGEFGGACRVLGCHR